MQCQCCYNCRRRRGGEHNNEYAIQMKEQSLEALACHVNSNEGCLLDYNSTRYLLEVYVGIRAK
jgi:hypothetical protein